MNAESGRIAYELCERINNDPVFNKWNKIAEAFGLKFNLKATPLINLDGTPVIPLKTEDDERQMETMGSCVRMDNPSGTR